MDQLFRDISDYRLQNVDPLDSYPPLWEKSSYAATAKLFNASLSSKTAVDPAQLIEFVDQPCAGQKSNFLEDASTHNEVCRNVRDWIIQSHFSWESPI